MLRTINKNPSKLKTGLEGCDILFGRDRTAHQSTVFFIRWACPSIRERADDCDYSQVHRLCVCASGSLMTVICSSFAFIKVSCLHFGQYRGKDVYKRQGLFLVNRIIIRQILSLCDCDEHKRVERYATTCRKVESDNYLLKISGSSRFRRNPQRG